MRGKKEPCRIGLYLVATTQCGNFRIFLSFRILREISFGEYKSSKTAVFGNSRGSEFSRIDKYQPPKSANMHKKYQISNPVNVQMADFALLDSTKLIARKI